MKKNKKIVSVIVGVLILVGVFYGGMVYGQSKTTTTAIQGGINRVGQFTRGGRTGGGGFISGEILSKDANSITVKIMNGDPNGTNTQSGSKIVFVDGSTTISKMVTGALSDLATGTQVSITGTANPDGSVIAKSIQIRPQMKTATPAQ